MAPHEYEAASATYVELTRVSMLAGGRWRGTLDGKIGWHTITLEEYRRRTEEA